jgi:type II secretory pathway component HofQ
LARSGAIARQTSAASAEEGDMIIRNAIAPAATAFALIVAPAGAGPCTDRIYQADLAVEKLLDAAAANGAPAPQSSFATMHRQPTPGTVASAEEKAGNLSPAQVQAITEDLDAARDADDKGDSAACEKALNEAERMLQR